MTETEEFVRNFEVLKQIQDYTDKIESGKLIIEWDTDLQNMKFDALRSWQCSPFPALGLIPKTYSLEDDTDEDRADMGMEKPLFHPQDYEDLKAMFDLIDFVSKGEKIIPPVFVEFHLIDAFTNRLISTSKSIADGTHRVRLAKKLGYKEIPILVYVRYNYLFEPRRHYSQIVEGNVIINSIQKNKI